MTVASISRKKTIRPPYLSVHMPSGTRISEPVSTGVAVSSPNCVAFRSSIFLIGMPITANIIQIAKHTVNASVLMMTTDHCRARRLVPGCALLPAHCRHRGLLEKVRAGVQARWQKGLFHDPHQAAPDVWSSEETALLPTGVDAEDRGGRDNGAREVRVAPAALAPAQPRGPTFSGKMRA